jgi:hypothetical protein
MPNTYKLTAVEINATGSVTLYSAPISPSTTTIIKSLYLTNTITSSIGLDVIVQKSGSNVDFYLIQSASIPIQTAFQPISDTLVLQPGDSLRIGNSIISSSDALLSYMEIT